LPADNQQQRELQSSIINFQLDYSNKVTSYRANLQKYQDAISTLGKELNQLSTYRLFAFLVSAVVLIILANARLSEVMFLVCVLAIIGFSLLVKHYNKLDHLKQHNTFLKEINEHEVSKLENKLTEFPDGQQFVNRDHSYVSDLDIFGRHSLFQMIDRTTTESGKALLAEWLSEPASKDGILQRQQAIKELAGMLDWRQDFQATGMHFVHKKNDYNKLLTWARKPIRLLPRQSRFMMAVIPLSVLSTIALGYFIFEFLYLGNFTGIIPLAIISIINGLVLKKVKPIAEEIVDDLHENIKVLGGYHSLITKIESEKFQSRILQQLQLVFQQKEFSAAAEIKKLMNIVETFKMRGGKLQIKHAFYPVFNTLWFLDIYLIILTEKWKQKNGSFLNPWASAVSEFEVLCSVAGFYYSNPSFTFPEIKDEPYIIHFEMLGHPLISAERRVCNDFDLHGRGEIAMITGSNMAGKSTFLRTVGVNLVLALMGAPCCAKFGKVSNMKIFTSMRTQDNLEEGVSSFYAELKRIEQLLKLIQSGEAIFFLLDEMFKGTNSQDRYKGGVSLIKQLHELNAFGIISTHDLELAKLAGNHMIVANFSFNSEIKDGEMLFNYALTEGICQDFNASELMKRSGIKILSSAEDMFKI
jgi:hypothetical protein